MAKRKDSIPTYKKVATTIGVLFCGVEGWLNAEHVAASEGWFSSLVVAVVIASAGAAAAIPLAERAWKSGQTAKTVGLAVFFVAMLVFSLGASTERVGSKRDGETSSAQNVNKKALLAKEAYIAAQKTAEAECANGRGPRCRDAEKAVTKARSALVSAPEKRIEDSMSVRIAAFLPFVTKEQVALYWPLSWPIALQLGGIFFLALGLAPRKEEPVTPKRKRAARKPTKTPRPPKATAAAQDDETGKVIQIAAKRTRKAKIAA